MKKLERAVRSAIVLAVTAAGLSGSRDVQQPEGWYLWGTSGFDTRGCASVWVAQSHQVVPGEHVVLDIQPVGADSIQVDLSEKLITVFQRTVCAPGASGIIFTAERNEMPADPSFYP